MSVLNPRLDFANIEVILLEPTAHARVVRDILRALGILNSRECKTIDEAADMVTVRDPDLLILDSEAGDEAVNQVIRDIRASRLGTNPFAVIIVLTWERDEAKIWNTLNAGADDLIAKPLSVKLIGDRIENLVRSRKRFVATTDYIGPDRRGGERQNSGDPEPIVVPNALRYKALGDEEARCDRETMRQARLNVGLQRLQRMTGELARIATMIEQDLDRSDGYLKPDQSRIDTLRGLIEEISDYVRAHDLKHVRDLVISLRKVMDSIVSAQDATVRQFEILRLHGHALLAALLEGADAPELLAQALKQAIAITGSEDQAGAA